MANTVWRSGNIVSLGRQKIVRLDASRQPAFDPGPHEIWCEERERDGHVDLAHAKRTSGDKAQT